MLSPEEWLKQQAPTDDFSKIIKIESGGKHTDKSGKLLTSSAGAKGITQLMPDTAKNPGYGIVPAKDESEQEYLRVGKEYFSALLSEFGDAEKAAAAYNTGPGNLKKAINRAEKTGRDWKEFLPKETKDYITKFSGNTKKVLSPEEWLKTKSTKEATPQEEPSMVDRMIGPGSPTYSLARGAIINPALAINQYAGNIVAPIVNKLFDTDYGAKVSAPVIAENKAYTEGRARLGREGLDVPELIGGIVSPVNKVIPNSTATNQLLKIAQQSVSGAVASGAFTPVLGEDFFKDKNAQLGFGALIAGAIPVGTLGVKSLASFVGKLPVTKAARETAIYNYLSDLSGENKQLVINELKKQGEIISGSKPTSGEMLADTTYGANIVREQERLAGGKATSSQFTSRFKEQEVARANELKNTFGDATTLKNAELARTEATTPLRDKALADANLYGETASKFEKELKKGSNQFGALLPKDKQDLLKGQVESIKSNGVYPLTTGNLVSKLDDLSNSSVDITRNAAIAMQGKLKRLTNENGVIDSSDLYNIRKEIGDDIKALINSKGGSLSAQAIKSETQLKKLIDAEINRASGSTVWTNYLQDFAKHSEKINQIKIGVELQNKLGVSLGDVEKAGAFANAINNSTSIIKKASGVNRYDNLEDVLTKEQMTSVNKVYADLSRFDKMKRLGKTTEQTMGAEKASEVKIAGVLERSVFIAREVLNRIQRGSKEEFDKKAAELLLDPNKLSQFLSVIPKSQTKRITEAMLARMSPKVREAFKSTYSVAPKIANKEQISRGIATNLTQATQQPMEIEIKGGGIE